MTRTAASGALGPGRGRGLAPRDGSLSRYVGNQTHGSVFAVGARAQSCAPPAPRQSPTPPWQEPGPKAGRERDMSDMQFLLLASELRTRAEEILVRAANTNDREVQEMMRVVAAGYEKLARQAEQRVREADKV
jgi:hypothetical protein